ncbi:VOC family protein [Candidatus Acetothermia bacterium]|nr:VOC family protein [Candidatus Acetothermia bacterium]MBI3642958.1 VOC family protein [Candidatus Acetothermia bacterium]
MANQLVWFDLPAINLDRAIKFYSAILGQKVKKEEYPGMSIGVFPHEGAELGGCIYVSEEDHPGDHGILVYFNCEGRLDEAVAAVPKNGGKVLKEKHQIGPYGWRAIVLDSEGNRIGLHSS